MTVSIFDILILWLVYNNNKFLDFFEFCNHFGNKFGREFVKVFGGRNVIVPGVEELNTAILNVNIWKEIKDSGVVNGNLSGEIKDKARKYNVTEEYVKQVYDEMEYVISVLLRTKDIRREDIDNENIFW